MTVYYCVYWQHHSKFSEVNLKGSKAYWKRAKIFFTLSCLGPGSSPGLFSPEFSALPSEPLHLFRNLNCLWEIFFTKVEFVKIWIFSRKIVWQTTTNFLFISFVEQKIAENKQTRKKEQKIWQFLYGSKKKQDRSRAS